MNQALYPVDKIEWCIYALYKQDTERIGTYFFVTVVGSFQFKMFSVRQGTQHFTDENKASRK